MIKIANNSTNIKDNYKPLKMDFIFNSIYQGFSPAKVYVNDLEKHNISIVQEGINMFFGGEAKEIDYLNAIEYFKSTVLPNRTPKYSVAKVFYSSEIWKDLLLENLQDYQAKLYERLLYKHNLIHTPIYQPIDKSIKITNINQELLNKEYNNKKGLLEELIFMWDTVDNFLKNGFGSCGVNDSNITGWCTAEYMSDKTCGIGIETVKEYQKQGIAASNAYNLLTMCKQKNITPYWDCYKTNVGSVKTAEKCGFNKILEYKVIFLRF